MKLNKNYLKFSIAIFLIALGSLVFCTTTSKALVTTINEEEDPGIKWETDAGIHFNNYNDWFLNLNFKRFFLNELEYEINIAGDILVQTDPEDSDHKMYKFDPVLSNCKIVNAPFLSSGQSIGINEMYGVLKLYKEDAGPGIPIESSMSISLLRSSEFQDPSMITPEVYKNGNLVSFGIESLNVPLVLPEEAIIYEDQNDINFPDLVVDNDNRIVYFPIKFFNYSNIYDYLKYEIFEEENEEIEVIDPETGSYITTTIYDYSYSNDPDYRLVDDDEVEEGIILKRVHLISQVPTFFNNKDINDIPIVDISGLSIVDTNNEYQITITGKTGYVVEEEDPKIEFISASKDPNAVDRPIQISYFKANDEDEGPVKGPPLYFSWQTYPFEGVTSTLSSEMGTIYQGTSSIVDNLEITDFYDGTYSLVASNGLGSKIFTMEIIPPDPEITIRQVAEEQIDDFTVGEVLSELSSITFYQEPLSFELAIDVFGNPPNNISLKLDGQLIDEFNQNNIFHIEEISETDIHPGFQKQYRYILTQIASDNTDHTFTITNSDIEKNITITPFNDVNENVFITNTTNNKDFKISSLNETENENKKSKLTLLQIINQKENNSTYLLIIGMILVLSIASIYIFKKKNN